MALPVSFAMLANAQGATLPTAAEPCQGWCAGHKKLWSVKCAWKKACSGCAECSLPPIAAEPCQGWCAGHKNLWSVKCTWGACSSCAECNPSKLIFEDVRLTAFNQADRFYAVNRSAGVVNWEGTAAFPDWNGDGVLDAMVCHAPPESAEMVSEVGCGPQLRFFASDRENLQFACCTFFLAARGGGFFLAGKRIFVEKLMKIPAGGAEFWHCSLQSTHFQPFPTIFRGLNRADTGWVST